MLNVVYGKCPFMLSVANKPAMLNFVMLNVVMLTVIMLNVIMLTFVMLSVVTRGGVKSRICFLLMPMNFRSISA